MSTLSIITSAISIVGGIVAVYYGIRSYKSVKAAEKAASQLQAEDLKSTMAVRYSREPEEKDL